MKYKCKDCPDRAPACHDTCELYQSIKKKRHDAYTRYVSENTICADYTDYVIKQVYKQKKRKRR